MRVKLFQLIIFLPKVNHLAFACIEGHLPGFRPLHQAIYFSLQEISIIIILNSSAHFCVISKFADDTKVGRTVKDDDDRDLLQAEINGLVQWAETWQMSFNASKCKVIHFGKKNNQLKKFNSHGPGLLIRCELS